MAEASCRSEPAQPVHPFGCFLVLAAFASCAESAESTGSLALVEAPGLPPERPLQAIWVEPDGIGFDRPGAEEVSASDRAPREASRKAAVKLAAFRVAGEVRRGPLLVRSLLEALRAGAGSPTALRVHRDAPFEIVARVLFTARQAGLDRSGIFAVVQTSQGRRELPIVVPPSCPIDTGGGGTCCLVPHVRALGSGLELRAALSWRSQCNDLAVTRDGRTMAHGCEVGALPWGGRVVQVAKGVCPTLPARSGTFDREGLSTLLRRLQERTRPCDRALVAPERATRWADVASIMALLYAEGHHALEFGLSDEMGASDCSRGAVVGSP